MTTKLSSKKGRNHPSAHAMACPERNLPSSRNTSRTTSRKYGFEQAPPCQISDSFYQKGRQVATIVCRLSRSQCCYYQKLIPATSDPGNPRLTIENQVVNQVGSTTRLPSDSHGRRRRMENRGLNTLRPPRVHANALPPDQRPGHLPTFCQ